MAERAHPDPDRFLLALGGVVSEAVSADRAFDLVSEAALRHLGCVYTGLLLTDSRAAGEAGSRFRHRGYAITASDPAALLLQSMHYWDGQRAATRWDNSDQACEWSAWPLWHRQKLAGVFGVQWPVGPGTQRLPGAMYDVLCKLAASLLDRGLTIEELHLAQAELLDENQYLREEIHNRFRPENFIWVSGAMDELCQAALRVASSTATVLITGETGTGKELLAHLIHQHSQRANGPFIRVNCAALPETLLESELFGHVRGAFTGATADRKGRFEAADNGTIFLDEIGDMSPKLQVRLLRVLQEREFERVGEGRTRKINVRVIVATHRDLAAEVAANRFREDLFYRLNVVYLHLPPLRERPDDILPLAEFFLSRYNQENLKRVQIRSPAVVAVFQRYPWPGNVRELQNCIEKAVILAPGEELTIDLLPATAVSLAADTPAVASPPSAGAAAERLLGEWFREEFAAGRFAPGEAHRQAVAAVEKPLLEAVLDQTGGNQLAASRVLGINRNTLRAKLRQYGIRPGPARETPA